MECRNSGNSSLLAFLASLEAEATKRGSKSAYSLRKAKSSVAKCGTRITSGNAALKLEGIGAATAKKIDDFLDKNPPSSHEVEISVEGGEDEDTQVLIERPVVENEKKKRKRGHGRASKEYVPRKGSFPHAVLLHYGVTAFSKGSTDFDMSKPEILRGASKYYVDPSEGDVADQHFNRDLLLKTGRSKYRLTPGGAALANVLRTMYNLEVTPPIVRVSPQLRRIVSSKRRKLFEVAKSDEIEHNTTLNGEIEEVLTGTLGGTPERRRNVERLLFGSLGDARRTLRIERGRKYKVKLIIDSRERMKFAGESSAASSSENFMKMLEDIGVPFERRQLSVGDMLWVATPEEIGRSVYSSVITSSAIEKEDQELVLEYVVERKQLSDVVSSIIDGRCNEQRYRLTYASCSLSRVIYLVEGDLDHSTVFIGKDRVRAALVSLLLGSDFYIHNTRGVSETVNFLAEMTRYQQRLVDAASSGSSGPGGVTTVSTEDNSFFSFRTFTEVTAKSGKHKTVSCVFGMQLAQIPQVTGDTAQIVIDNFATPRLLLEAYAREKNEKARLSMLTGISSENVAEKVVSAVSSKNIYLALCKEQPH